MKSRASNAARRQARRKQKSERGRGIEVKQCPVCLTEIPDTFSQEHHEQPKSAGGEAGPISSLCAGCHHNVHRVADLIMSKRAGLAEDSVRIMYPDPASRERVFALANTVVEYMIMKRDGHLDGDLPVRVMIELPPKVKLAASMMANDHRGPTGRKLGLATWVASLVKKQVYERYPQLDPSKDESWRTKSSTTPETASRTRPKSRSRRRRQGPGKSTTRAKSGA